jgi:hypothetical protein
MLSSLARLPEGLNVQHAIEDAACGTYSNIPLFHLGNVVSKRKLTPSVLAFTKSICAPFHGTFCVVLTDKNGQSVGPIVVVLAT